jgi:hypothetical protein
MTISLSMLCYFAMQWFTSNIDLIRLY